MCSQRAYKQRKREEKISNSNKQVNQERILDRTQLDIIALKTKDYLSIKETHIYLGISESTIFHLLKKGTINALDHLDNLTPERKEWLTWAKEKIEWFDPFTRHQDDLLSNEDRELLMKALERIKIVDDYQYRYSSTTNYWGSHW